MFILRKQWLVFTLTILKTDWVRYLYRSGCCDFQQDVDDSHSPGCSHAQFHMCMGAQVELDAFVETFHDCKLKQKCGCSKQRHLWTFEALVHQCHVKMQSYLQEISIFKSAITAARLIKIKPNLQTACLTCGFAGVYPTISARRLGKHH